MKKNLFKSNLVTSILLVALFCFATVSCDNSDMSSDLSIDFITSTEVSPILYMPNGYSSVSRIDYYLNMDIEERYAIWKNRLKEVQNILETEDQRQLISEINKKLTFEAFKEKDKYLDMINSLNDEFQRAFTNEEAFYILETLKPFRESLKKSIESMALVEREYLHQAINNRNNPQPVLDDSFENERCNCSWSCFSIVEDECCNKGGCQETDLGCAPLWLGDCTKYCISDLEWDCS